MFLLSKRRQKVFLRSPSRWVWFLMLLFFSSCSQESTPLLPTLVPPADTPVVASPKSTLPPELNTSEPIQISPTPVEQQPVESAASGETTAKSSGIRPQDARQLWVPDAGPEQPVDGRPPPMQVPLSLHPDDHYWLSRPIPSRSRNFDLEWYPFGNDVLKSDLEPYRIHHGMDFPNDTGTPVLAAAGGTVIHAGPLPSPRNGVNYYGNTVIIEHDWQWHGRQIFTLYAHTLELFVQVGDTVNQGQLIAGVGSSGEVSGPHLHFEVRVGQNIYGDARNPALWLAPFEGMGTLAGRFVDKNGRYITTASVRVRPVSVNIPARTQLTYHSTIQSDPIWRENFVFADLPAGEYELLVTGIDNIQYIREVEVRPGQTTFVVISTNFEFNPTSTPLPIATEPPPPADE